MLVGMSQHHVNALIDLLDLEPIEVNIFRGVNPDEERQRIFGGQVAGQALVAAARTVDDDRAVHSHVMFTTAMAKIAASEKSITGPRLAAAPITTKMQKITLKTSSVVLPSPNR